MKERDHMQEPIELSVVMPCLNESETLERCIRKALGFFKKNNISGEVVIADNGSTDGSQAIALKNNARVIDVKEKGYGSALFGGISAAKGKFIIMGDSDDSYDFSKMELFVGKLREGFDLVMGNRFKGGIKKGAMPFLHRYLGNPVLSFIGRLFFGAQIGDFHCGLRGFTKDAFNRMQLQTKGMEFASEMVVKATILEMKIAEVPTVLSPDGRTQKPHLNTWRDGWRHLRFLLMYSPKWLFLYPGIIMILLGAAFSMFILVFPVEINGIRLGIHSLFYMFLTIYLGLQFLMFYAHTKVYAVVNGLLPESNRFKTFFKYFNLERGLFIGFGLIILGLILTGKALTLWSQVHYGSLEPAYTMNFVIPAVFALAIGVQIVLSSFFLSIMGIKKT